jgi:hypothetical protein
MGINTRAYRLRAWAAEELGALERARRKAPRKFKRCAQRGVLKHPSGELGSVEEWVQECTAEFPVNFILGTREQL